MIRRQTGVAVLVFVALVVVAMLLARPQEESAQTPTPAPEPFWSVASGDIVAVVVEDLRMEQVIELVRDEEALWLMIRPEELAVDPARVERAVSWLAEPRPRAEIQDASDLSAFELDAPHYRISLRTVGGLTFEMTVGREAPTGGSRYASTEGRPGVWVLSSVGLDEVLRLRPDLLPTPTPEPTAGPSATPEPTPELAVTPEPTQEPEG